MRKGLRWMPILVWSTLLVEAARAAPGKDEGESFRLTLRNQVGEGCQIRETAHWLIVHKADPQWVEATAKMLESTHDRFFEQFRKAGFEPKPIEQKLVCVLLGKQEEFAQYLDRVRDSVEQPVPDRGPPPDRRSRPVGLGSYSERTNRIQLCDIRSIPGRPGATQNATRTEWENVARIAHEAAHQLSFNAGILKQHGGCPMWLGEGLAASFEFSEADKPFGPLTDNLSPRVARVKQFDANDKMMTLKQIVTMSPYEAHQPENKGAVYVHGCGLFRFLIAERPAQLKKYLIAVADRPRGPVRRGQVLADFEAAFGPVDQLETDWKQFLKRLGQPAPLSGRKTSGARPGTRGGERA